jgi:acyl transferase domain-containing protein/phospholipid N-methyltransferase/acyl carrier protein
LLGKRCWVAESRDLRFESRLTVDSPAYLHDHTVFDTPVFPSSGFIEMALTAGSRIFGRQELALEDICFRQALILDEPKLVQTVIDAVEGDRATFRVYSKSADIEEGASTLHVSGSIRSLGATTHGKETSLSRRCAQATYEVPSTRLYDFFRKRGVVFGPRFRAVTKLFRGSQLVVARIEAPAALEGDFEHYQFHPALLDACSQASGVFSFDLPDRETLLQSGVEKILYFKRPGNEMWVSAQVRKVQDAHEEKWLADLDIFDDSGAICMVVQGQAARRATHESVTRRKQDAHPDFYELEWTPKAQPITEKSGRLASPGVIASSAREAIAAVLASPELAKYAEFLLKLDDLAIAFVVQALRQMGWPFRPGDRFRDGDAALQLAVAPDRARFFERLLGVLAESGTLKYDGSGWTVNADLPLEDPQAEVRTLSKLFPNAIEELSLVEDCGSRLSQVLRGTVNPLEFLFPKGEVNRIGALYEDSAGAVATHAVLEGAVTKAIEGWPADKALRILEIGGGTGASTRSVLTAVSKARTEYTFTDVSPRFLTHAQAKFRAFPFIEFRVLDIEQTPAAQGFSTDGYDLILATNVLHATRNLRQTLSHVHQLLGPEGTLIMIEGTSPSAWLDLVFGMLDGWWRFEDRDIRAFHPLLPGSRWKELLRETGFEETIDASADPTTASALSRQAVIIARKARFAETTAATGGWLILGDAGGVGEQVVGLLEAKGAYCHLLTATDCLQEIDTALEEIVQSKSQFVGVVHLWCLDDTDANGITLASLNQASLRGPGAALHLVQSLARRNEKEQPRLWIATRNAQPAGTDATISGLASAPIWGFGKVIALEYPSLWGGIVDLPDDRSANDAISIVESILGSEGEDQVAIRNGHRLVARLTRRFYDHNRNLTVRADGTYLITGGLGGLGLEIARWLVGQGARNIALLGRNSPSAASTDVMEVLKTAGARVCTLQANVSDAEAMRDAFRGLQSWPDLRGVIHAAGLPAAGSLEHLSLGDLHAAFAAKVTGTWTLHELTQHMALDFFVLCSSMVAVWGAKGQADYAAANSFLDVFAHYRRALGLPAVSVNWGPLAGAGMLPAQTVGDLARMGVATMRIDAAAGLLGELLRTDAIQTAPVNIDWRLFTGIYEARGKKAIFENVEVDSKATFTPQTSDVSIRLREAPAGERLQILREHVQVTLARVLGLRAAQIADSRMGFFNIGLDSLTAMEFRDCLESSLGLSLPSTVALDYSTVETLSSHLHKIVWGPPPVSEVTVSLDTKDQSLSARTIEELSEEEVEELLLRKLETI